MCQCLTNQQIPLGIAQMARLRRGASRQSMFGQKPQAQSMYGRDIGALDRHRLVDQSIGQKAGTDPFAQLASRGLGKGHGKDTFGPDNTAFHPIGQLGLDAVGLARAGTRGNDDQTLICIDGGHGHSSSSVRMKAVTRAEPSVSA